MSVLAVANNKIDPIFRDKSFEHPANDLQTGIADDVADEENIGGFADMIKAEKVTGG